MLENTWRGHPRPRGRDSDLLMPRNSAELVGQLFKLQCRFHRRSLSRAAQPKEGRLETGQQDSILPHRTSSYVLRTAPTQPGVKIFTISLHSFR